VTHACARSLAHTLAWTGDGAAHLRGLMTRMGEEAFAAPSALRGWSRGHVLTHVARNADAMINLLTWARTGVRTPAYVSREQRDADIEAGAHRTPAKIREDVVESSDRLAQVVRAMPAAAWSAQVQSVQGRDLRAIDIPWLRAQEMWIHAVDLDVGASFADMPAPMVADLLADAVRVMGERPDCPALCLVASDGTTWSLGAPDAPTTVTGPVPILAAWLLGRSNGRELRTSEGRRPPAPPRWI
jgi:maleylpyruvate isomerase